MQQTTAGTASDLVRQGSVVRSDAIAKLKRAASQREVRAKPTLLLQPSDVQNRQTNDNSIDTLTLSAPSTTNDSLLSPASHEFFQSILSPSVSPGAKSNGSSDILPSPSRSPVLPPPTKERGFARSPLPSLEQLRARILQERETANTNTADPSHAARAYAYEKLLGNSGEDVFSDPTRPPDQQTQNLNGNQLEDIASDDENRSDMRTRRQSVVNRPRLRRSMTFSGLSSRAADAQRIAESVRGAGFLAVPGAANNRISRIRQRRIDSVSEDPSPPPPPPLTPESVTDLDRSQSQRQIARTQLLRKLSSRGRGLPIPHNDTIQQDRDSIPPLIPPPPVTVPTIVSCIESPPSRLPDVERSPSLFSDEDQLEDDAFYKLYSPAIGYDYDAEDDEDPVKAAPSFDELPSPSMQTAKPTMPSTPPQHFAYRQSAAVPCDPSPGTDIDLGERRRSQWMHASPSGVTVPLRFSNSLISTTAGLETTPTSQTTKASPAATYKSRETRGDWPVSIGSTRTLLLHHDTSTTVDPMPKYPDSVPSNYTTSPSLAATTADESAGMMSLLSVPTSREKPSERLQALLGTSFVREYADDIDFDNRSKTSLVADDTSADEREREVQGLGMHLGDSNRLSPYLPSDALTDDASEGEVDDAYLRKVDRITDKLRRLAKPNKLTRAPSARQPPTQTQQTQGDADEPAFIMAVPQPRQNATDLSTRPKQERLEADRLDLTPGMAQRMREQLQDKKKASPSPSAYNRALPDPPQASGDDSVLVAPVEKQDEQRTSSSGQQIGLFTSLRRKASSLRRTPSSAKEGGFWSRRNAAAKNSESPKMPSEATFISAPIMAREASSHFAPRLEAATYKQTAPSDQLQTSRPTQDPFDLQRNGSISSTGSANIHPDLQDGTADRDVSITAEQSAAAASLGPSAAAMYHRYSQMLTAPTMSVSVPGVTTQHMRDPPRRFVLAEPVFQVISSTTIKDRFLFLFNDLLIIAKPVSSSDDVEGGPLGKMKEAGVLPTVDWKFAVKNILELHRLNLSITTSSRTATAKTRAQNPVLWSFVKQFSQDTDAAVRTLTTKTGLKTSSASIAQVLYQTPELDRADLTRYLTQPSHRQLLKEYVGQQRLVGVSIESALRSLLLDLRFPTDLNAFEALLINFSQTWTAHNASTIKADFTSQLASDLVFAIMALNDALHTDPTGGAVATPGLFSAPCRDLSKEDFVQVFRQHDPRQVLSDRTLSRIYLSIRSEPLVQALDKHEPRYTIRIKGGILPTRMTYAQPAEPVTLQIPAPDSDLAIRLYAKDTTFEPPVLTFAHSREASFTMWSKLLGPKQVVFVRAGRNARFYGGTETDVIDNSVGPDAPPLPRSFNVTVERAFMKHSFTLSSASAEGTKRFMFSFANSAQLDTWSYHLKTHVDASAKAKADAAAVTAKDASSVLKRATEAIAMQVLRDTLIVPDENGPLLPQHFRSAPAQPSAPPEIRYGAASGRLLVNTSAGLDRAPSTSRHYYAASGVGRHERELLIPPSASTTTMMSGSSSSSTLYDLASANRAQHQQHTKGSASLSMYPPLSRSALKSTTLDMNRANSTRSASAHQPAAATSRLRSEAVVDKSLLGTQIVSVTRLNSLLSAVLAHHQAQTSTRKHK